MARDGSPELTPLQREWFDAARRGDLRRLQDVRSRGVDINVVDQHGRTALFYAMAPFGGQQEMVSWLVEQGIDPNVRDRSGESALEFGQGAVTSAAENNTVGHARNLLLEHGYRESARELARRPRPAGAPPRRKLSDYWGRWRIDSGEHQGAEVHLSGSRVRSDVEWVELEVDRYSLDDAGRLVLHGSGASGALELTVEVRGRRVALLRLGPGPDGGRTELRIKR